MIEINKEGNLIIDTYQLLKSISPEKKMELINYLSIDEKVIENVTDQITDGMFYDSASQYWSGSEIFGAEVCPTTALNQARRKIALVANEIAQKEIIGLQEELSKQNQKVHDLTRELDKYKYPAIKY